MKTYPASWNLVSGSIVAFQIVFLCGLFALDVVVFRISPGTSATKFEYILVDIVFPVAITLACLSWTYRLLSIITKGYKIYFSESTLIWSTLGALIPTKKSIPLKEVSGLTRLKPFGGFQQIILFRDAHESRLYALLSESDCEDLMHLIWDQAQAEQGAAANP
jgi:hypothetical protein